MICFINGEFIQEETVFISPQDRGFTLGDGVFDTMLILDGKMQYANEHFARLYHDTKIMGIECNINLLDSAEELLKKNEIQQGRYILRSQVTRGISPRGLSPAPETKPTIVMRVVETPPPDLTPILAIIVKQVRRNEFSPLSKIKSLNYADNILALIEARAEGADEAILLNTQGFVTCASASNIFIRENNKWLTPPLSDGVMAGITRARLITDLNAAEESITPERLARADEIIQCNSVIGRRNLIMQR